MQKTKCSECEKDILLPIVQRTLSFLSENMGVHIISQDAQISFMQKVQLKKNTVMISTGGSIQVLISMSYDDKLLNKLMESFLEGETVALEEFDEVRESVACEVINIIIGNALINPKDDTVLSISPPILIQEAKSLIKHKNSKIALSAIVTDFGDLLITVIGTKDLFIDDLELKEL